MKKQKEDSVSEKDIVFDGTFWIDKNGVKHRYVDPMSDEGFKILFGSEGKEELLMALLNEVIPDANIVQLSYKNNEHFGIFKEDGKAVFDVYCEDADGVRFLVEMQNWSQHHFNKRAVYYSTFAIQDQAAKEKKHQLKTLGKDEWDYNFAPVYVVCFLNFDMRKKHGKTRKAKTNEFISTYRYLELENGEELGDGTTLVFVEMKKFKKQLSECQTRRDRILHTLKNMFGQLEMPQEAAEDPMLETLYEAAQLALLPQEIRISYIKKIMTRNDILNSIAEQIADAREEAIAEGHAEGRAKGLAEGRAEGRAEERTETVRKLLAAGIPASAIADALGITVEECLSYTEDKAL